MALKLKGSTSGFVAIDAPSVAGNNTLILPENTGSAHQILANDITAGVTTFTQVTVSRNGDLTVPGTISIGGTLTYEDVTSVDSVGIVTARGLSIFGDTTGLNASGIGTFFGSTGNIRIDLHSTASGTGSQIKLHNDHGTAYFGQAGDTTGDLLVYNESNTNIRFFTNGNNERVRITGAGTVGIGTDMAGTPASTYPLSVYRATGTGYLYTETAQSTASAGLRAKAGASDYTIFTTEGTGQLAVYDNTNSAERIRIQSTGVVNIGDTTATALGDRLLQIGKTDRTGTYVELRTSTSGVGGIVWSDGTDNSNTGYRGTIEYAHATSYADSMYFKTAATERLRILGNGAVIICASGNQTEGHPDGDELTLVGTRTGMTIRSATDDYGNIFFSDQTSGTGEYAGAVQYNHNTDQLSLKTTSVDRVIIGSDGKLFTTRTHSSSNTGNHPALDIDTYSNDGSPQAAMATGIDFSVEGVHKKRLAVTYESSTTGSGDWIFYRDQGNNVGLRISANGYVTKPANAHFRATSSTAQNLSSGAGTVINYASELTDTGGNYDASNSTFTAPVAGVYIFTFNYFASPTNSYARAMLTKSTNGGSSYSMVHRGDRVSSTGNYNAQTSTAIIPLNAADKVRVEYEEGDLHVNTNYNYFQGYLVG